ncbi:double-stranded DNA binding protein [Yersinia phage vB_YenM_TG1]|uniref:Double-stranded DNA binding protein n=1 Tax=Yersinia phage vB_YenM_TG1 TaxID=1589265 RepID=A0A0B5A307_9CAUD|nr:transcriptional regulator [Yersinia phage vB_YenM_TG1]AJD82055.1 double-stranded DNA binding protein [Yersinia phage vB_YenM_TG1]
MKEAKKEKVEFDETIHGDELQKLIKDSSDQKIKSEGFLQIVKDNVAKAKELGIEAKKFNQLLNIYHKGIRERFEDEKTEVVDLYDSIFHK